MKKILFLISFIFSFIYHNAQERVNVEKPRISKEVITELSKSQGYMFMDNGEWFDADRFITREDVSLSLRKILKEEKDSRFCLDNFSNFQFRNISYDGKDYVILIKKAFNGQYKYNAIKKDWIGFNRYSYVILDKNELRSKLDNLEDSRINRIELSVISVPEYILDFGDKDILSEIESKIIVSDNKNESELKLQEEQNQRLIKMLEDRGRSIEGAPIQKPSTYKFIFHIYPFKEKNIVQFILYGYKENPNTKLKFPFFLETNPILDSDSSPYFGMDKMFNHCYYEIDYRTFSNFIKL